MKKIKDCEEEAKSKINDLESETLMKIAQADATS